MQVSINFVQNVLVVDTLMRQMELPFSASNLLHVYIVVHPKREPSTPFFKCNHYLRLRNSRQPQMRLITDNPEKDLFLNEFIWVLKNENSELGAMTSSHSQGTMAIFLTVSFSLSNLYIAYL